MCNKQNVCYRQCSVNKKFAIENVLQTKSLLLKICYKQTVCYRKCSVNKKFATENFL